MKTLDKQILGAVAIGIGAGMMLNPVTAYANEDVIDNNGSGDVDQDTTPQDPISEASNACDECSQEVNNAETEYSAAQSEAEQAQEKCESIDVETSTQDEAQQAIDDASGLIEQAEAAAADADQDLLDAQAAANRANDAIEDAREYNEEVNKELEGPQQEYDNAYSEYQAAKAVSDAAEEVRDTAVDELNAIEDRVEIGDIVTKKVALAKMNKEDPDYQTKLEELGNILVERYGLVSGLSSLEKLKYEKGELTFVFEMDANGEVIISKSYESERYVETVHYPAGYYNGTEELNESEYDHVTDYDNGKVAWNDTELEQANDDWELLNEDNKDHVPGATWTAYEEIDGQVVKGVEVSDFYLNDKKVYWLTVHEEGKYNKVNKTLDQMQYKLEQYADSPDEAIEKASAYYRQFKPDFYTELAEEGLWAVDKDANGKDRVEFVPYMIESGEYRCHIYVVLRSTAAPEETRMSVESIYSGKYYNKVGDRDIPVYEPYTAVDKVFGTNDAADINNFIEKQNAVGTAEKAYAQAMRITNDAQKAYIKAMSKLMEAKDAVKAKLIPESKIANAELAYGIALGEIEAAQEAKIAAYNAIDEAKDALGEANTKLEQIKERDAAAGQGGYDQGQGGEEPGGGTGEGGTGEDEGQTPGGGSGSSGSGQGTGGGSSDNGGSSGGSDTADNGSNPEIRPSADTQNPSTTITPAASTPSSVETPQFRGTKSFFVDLSDKLAEDIRAQIRAAEAAQVAMAAEPEAVEDATAKAQPAEKKVAAETAPEVKAEITDEETALAAAVPDPMEKGTGPLGAAAGVVAATGLLSLFLLLKKKEDSYL